LVWKDDNIGCLNNYAYYLSERGIRLDDAERMSYRTIKAEPTNATYLDTYAWILFMQKRYKEAKTYIDQTLEYDKDSSSVLFEHAGDIYYHTGDVEQAVNYWREAYDCTLDDDARKQLLERKIKHKKYVKE
jgi:tetratricopeptide (TPR) repeat protein